MRTLLIAALLGFLLSGCYTMIYPPPGQMVYQQGGDSLSLPDSAVAGRGITIINQNQIILDHYYQDDYYYRGDQAGGYGYWDPYYYDPRGYHQDRRWRHGWHHWNGNSGTPSSPPVKKPRREKDYRRSEAPTGNAPEGYQAASDQGLFPYLDPVAVNNIAPVQSDPGKADPPPPKAADDSRTLRTAVQPVVTPVPDKPADDTKKSRRDDSRGR